MRYPTLSLVVLAVLAAASAFVASHAVFAQERPLLPPGQQRRAQALPGSPSPTAGTLDVRPRGPLREAKHVDRLDRVLGVVRGMTNKLTNLSSRLDKHLMNIERRIVALRAAGHDITVDAELTAAQTATKALQEKIASAVRELDALADNEKPRTVMTTIRGLIRDIRADLRTVQAAFKKLRLAIRDDIKAKPSPSPTTSPLPSPSILPLGSPSPTPFTTL